MTTAKDEVAGSLVRARAELEQALTALEHLPAFDPGTYAFAAHALGNYLSVADATVQLLERSLDGHPNEQVHSWLEGLRHTTGLMMHTTTQLMNSSASASPKLRFGRVDLALLVGRGCDFYRRRATRKGIALDFETFAPVPLAWGDRVAVAAVLDNLLSNAVKFSTAGTTIRVQVGGEAGRVVCRIHDQGPGVTDEDRPKLFQRGAKLSAAPTAGEPSTGYGLAVAKELIDRLGGQIWCENRPDPGACFAFALPLCPADQLEDES